jgi:hypothetical protein
MIESATILTLCMLYLIFFRSGKTPPLENPLVIERAGQYHLTLAPHLNLAQPFIEAIVGKIGNVDEGESDSATQYFEVRDKQVAAHGFDFYLLAITRRNGMLYIQAARPASKDQADLVGTISEFAQKVLAKVPGSGESVSGEKLVAAAQQVAQLRGVQIKTL